MSSLTNSLTKKIYPWRNEAIKVGEISQDDCCKNNDLVQDICASKVGLGMIQVSKDNQDELEVQRSIVIRMCSPLNHSRAHFCRIREFLSKYLLGMQELYGAIDDNEKAEAGLICQKLLSQLPQIENTKASKRAKKKILLGAKMVRIFCEGQRQTLEGIQDALTEKNDDRLRTTYMPFVKEFQSWVRNSLPQLDDYQCSICLSVLYLPITLEVCRHSFCKPCLNLYMNDKIWHPEYPEYPPTQSRPPDCSQPSHTLTDETASSAFKCPLCRSHFEETTYQSDVGLQNLLNFYFPHEQRRRRREDLGIIRAWFVSAHLKLSHRALEDNNNNKKRLRDSSGRTPKSLTQQVVNLACLNPVWNVYEDNLERERQDQRAGSRGRRAQDANYYDDLTQAQGMIFLYA
ncbi:hypothetical protein J3Q64DRAFT_1851927 [Phycomyces blakesleeanus]|uniref:RING-type domain-containing protein n=2 Tax=Phycomyces blakesleeanus TaxID=4837 RepID=A0A162PW98_PHYB8|nr:hypothetical protein PHYBLDRAFT_61230 [Phycomyces blakesleeanus NRRL 1555(-)]OAD74716.1 hypothetical protein PHYBLDRAFT_61230 [Phycomyces blakesleeanus NRRL 1555(-)]|eukprot:XP_018292756.1 hypothetical protein PHYBLDRAFT_61230 [Phycomyces blakesleeanus NRRL 1555(-)]